LVLKKRIKEIKGDYLMGKGRIKGITIPLKYLSCRKKKPGGHNGRLWALLSLF